MYPFTELPPPLTTYEFYVLLVLAHGDAHAYKIKYKTREFSKGSVKLADSTLSKLLTRMAERGMVEIAGPQETGANPQKRMHYSLGHHGKRALKYELDRMKHAIALAGTAGYGDAPLPSDVDLLLEDLGC